MASYRDSSTQLRDIESHEVDLGESEIELLSQMGVDVTANGAATISVAVRRNMIPVSASLTVGDVS